MAISAQHAMSQWPKKASRSIRNLSSHADRESINRSLALFSLGLGITQLLAPRALGRAIGVGEHRATVMRLCGVREIASGVGMLSGRAPAAFAMARDWSAPAAGLSHVCDQRIEPSALKELVIMSVFGEGPPIPVM